MTSFGRGVAVDDDDSRSSVGVSRCALALAVHHRRQSSRRQSAAARAVGSPRRRRRSDVSDVADGGELDDRREHHDEARHLTADIVANMAAVSSADFVFCLEMPEQRVKTVNFNASKNAPKLISYHSNVPSTIAKIISVL